MCQFIETIKVKNKELQNIEFHNIRFNSVMNKLFKTSEFTDLSKIINVPVDEIDNSVYKCRLIYSEKIEKIEFVKYQNKEINTLKIVTDNDIDYRFKYLDRERINYLYGLRSGCDDVLIVKNNKITDSSFTNIVLWDGENWVTPQDPLLKGTKRAKLIKDNTIVEKDISISELKLYLKVSLINSMLELGECVLGIKNIVD